MPYGVSVPCGVRTDTRSPTLTPSSAARSPVDAAAAHRAGQIGDLRLQRGIDAFDLQRGGARTGRDEAEAVHRGGGADDVRQAEQLLRLRVIVEDAALLPHVHVRVRSKNPIPQLPLQPRHQRQRDDERHDADDDAQRRDE
jgi:hypothetical protein